MLKVPIEKEYSSILKKEVGLEKSDFFYDVLDFQKLKVKSDIVHDFVLTNNNRNLITIDKTTFSFLKRFDQSLAAILLNYDTHPEISLAIWRTLYEATILFVVISQTIVNNKNMKLFSEILSRYIDYGVIEESKMMNIGFDIKLNNILKKYENLNEIYQMNFEYDWINPAFSERQLLRLNRKGHPSFKDIAYLSQETSPILLNMMNTYKESSNVIHMTTLSTKLIDTYDYSKIIKESNDLTNIFMAQFVSTIIAQIDITINESDKPSIQLNKYRTVLTNWNNYIRLRWQ